MHVANVSKTVIILTQICNCSKTYSTGFIQENTFRPSLDCHNSSGGVNLSADAFVILKKFIPEGLKSSRFGNLIQIWYFPL